MTISRVAFALAAGAVLALMPHSADAVAGNATAHPEVQWALPQLADSGPVQVVLQTHGHAFGIRRFAHEVDKQLAGVRIYAGTSATCEAHPYATCVRVWRANWGDDGIGAYTSVVDEQRRRDITVNTYYGPKAYPRYPVMCHEFGHVLGMQHHKMHGVDGAWPNEVHLSHAELKALRAAYPKEKP